MARARATSLLVPPRATRRSTSTSRSLRLDGHVTGSRGGAACAASRTWRVADRTMAPRRASSVSIEAATSRSYAGRGGRSSRRAQNTSQAASKRAGTVEGEITTILCLDGQESGNRILFSFEGTYKQAGGAIRIDGTFEITGGTGI